MRTHGKVTLSAIAALPPNSILWDASLRGFGVRRQLRDAFYFIRTRTNGREVYRTIGPASRWTPTTARTEARRLLGLAATGELTRAGLNFDAIARGYLAAARTRLAPQSHRTAEHYLLTHWMPLGRYDLRSIAAKLDELVSTVGAPTAARSRTTLSSAFKWAMARGLASDNPVALTEAPREVSRDRVLSAAELRAVWHAADGGGFGSIVRLLILTGQRRSEVGGLRWSELDFSGSGSGQGSAEWRLPAARTKNRQPHFVWLGPLAVAQLPAPADQLGEFVFGLTRPFNDWTRGKIELDRRCGVPGFTIHDLRRSAATGLASLGVSPWIIEAVLNHVSRGHRAGIGGVYNRYQGEAEIRSALMLWSDHVARIVGGAAASDSGGS